MSGCVAGVESSRCPLGRDLRSYLRTPTWRGRCRRRLSTCSPGRQADGDARRWRRPRWPRRCCGSWSSPARSSRPSSEPRSVLGQRLVGDLRGGDRRGAEVARGERVSGATSGEATAFSAISSVLTASLAISWVDRVGAEIVGGKGVVGDLGRLTALSRRSTVRIVRSTICARADAVLLHGQSMPASARNSARQLITMAGRGGTCGSCWSSGVSFRRFRIPMSQLRIDPRFSLRTPGVNLGHPGRSSQLTRFPVMQAAQKVCVIGAGGSASPPVRCSMPVGSPSTALRRGPRSAATGASKTTTRCRRPTARCTSTPRGG